MSIVVSLLPVILKLIDWILLARSNSVQSRQAYLAFIEAMSNEGLISAKLHQSYDEQRKKNLEEIERMNKK